MSTLNLSAILQVIDRATAPMRAINRQAQQLGQGMQQTRAQLRQLQQTQGNINSFRSLGNSLQQNEQAMQTQRQRVQQLTDAISATRHPTVAMQNALRSAQNVLGQMTDRTEDQRQQLARLQAALHTAGVDTNHLGDAERRLSSDVDRTNEQLAEQRRRLEQVREQQRRLNQMREQHERISRRTQNIGAAASIGAAAGAMAMSVPIKAYAEAEDAATTLRVSMMKANGEVAAQYKDINALANNLGNRLPGTTADFQLMMAKLVQQGISLEAILGGVGEASGFLGVQLKMPFEDAAEFAAKMQDATKTTEGDMLSLMDVIQKSFYLGVDPNNMLQGFSKISSGMKTIRAQGLEGAKAMAPLLIMADQAAMAGESAGNAYSKIFKAMMDTGNIKDTFDDLKKSKGISMSMNFTDGKGEFGGLDNMFKQLETMKKMSTEDRLPILSDLFGNDSETIQALNLLIDKGKAGYDETIAKMDAQADLQKRVNEQLGTLKNLWDAASGTFTNAMANFGEAIAPELKDLTILIADISEALSDWAKRNPMLANTLMKIAGGLIFLLAIIAVLSAVLLAILGPIAALRMAFVMLNISMSVNPIYLFVLALVVLAAIIYYNWDAIKGFWNGLGLGEQIVLGLVTALGVVAMAFKALGIAMMINPLFLALALLAGAAYLIISNWDAVGPVFKAVGAAILDGITLPIRLAIDAINLLIRGINMIPGVKIPKIPNIPTIYQSGSITAALEGTTPSGTPTPIAPFKAANASPLSPAAAQQTVTNHFAASPITITGVTDPKAVGTEVQRQLAANQRQQAARQRSALSDTE